MSRIVTASRLSISFCFLVALLVLAACGQSTARVYSAASAPTASMIHAMPAPATAVQPTAVAPSAATNVQVTIDNFSFTPQVLTISAGTTVTWINHDDVPHTVTSTEQRFASAALDTDDQFSHQFTVPGTYPYYCTIHPQMTATIVVK